MFRAMRVKVVTLHRERLGRYVLPVDLAPGEFTLLDVTELAGSPAISSG